jgi:hypothetical protein
MDSIMFYYRNLPKNYGSLSKDDFVISQTKLNEIINKVKQLKTKDKPITLFIKDIGGLLVKETINDVNYYGIDFQTYFDSRFSGNKEDLDIPADVDIVVIYNVGLEASLNKDFSSQLLLGLIEKFKGLNKHVFVFSHMNYSTFFKKYEIEIVNTINGRKKEDEKIF